MRLRRTPSFDEESARFGLRFCCEDCAYFDGAGRCRHGWPTELHRREPAATPSAASLALAPAELVFCKEFELC